VSAKRLLVVGATGLVGRAAIAHFSKLEGWHVASISRREHSAPQVTHVRADLRDPQSCRAALAAIGPITHVLYAAFHERPDVVEGWRDPEQMQTNLTMLQNLLDAVEDGSPSLQCVVALQGGKAYGVHLGRVPVPAKERWPRASHRIFYWSQEDLLKERAAQHGWRYALLRPQRILGDAVASPLSIVLALGIYAAITREQGLPLTFPGGGRYVNACSDSRLIAQAVEFCAVNDHTANETYNVVNGDWVDWRDLWPSIAESFTMEAGEDRPLSLALEMPRHKETWRRLAMRHNLLHDSLDAVAGRVWDYADLVLGHGVDSPPHNVMSPIKIMQAGFTPCRDTGDSFAYWFGRLQRRRVLPS
jgi:nucleoside-diphosphate-sugar epimerase